MGNYYLYRIGQFLARVLPYQLSRALVLFLCDLHFCFSKTDRRAVAHNLRLVLKKDTVPIALVRAVFRNFGEYLLEFFTMRQRVSLAFIASSVSIKNSAHLDTVLKKGKGAILVSAHLGNWEMGGAVLSLLGYPLSVVALAHQDPKVNALFNAQREFTGTVVIQTEVAVRRVTEHLKDNRLVAILADRDFGNHGIMMDFLGSRVMIPKGAAYFSLKTGAPIVPVFFERTSNNCFEINIYAPIEPPSCTEGRIPDPIAKEYIQQYLTFIENEIRRNPAQWLLFRELGVCHT